MLQPRNFLGAGATLLLLVAGLAAVVHGASYKDWQTVDYLADNEPFTLSGHQYSIMPFFSPDYSADVLVDMIQNAKSNVTIQTPSMNSWSSCASETGPCGGCTPTKARDEAFPIFSALLNALHRGVRVRIMTNDYRYVECEGMIAPASFLKLNGADIRYMASITYTHAKYMMVDDRTVSISSVNWSKTSYTRNREAGAVISGIGAASLMAYLNRIYDLDWSHGIPYNVSQTYSHEDMTIIRNTAPVPVKLPALPTNPDWHITPKPSPITVTSQTTVWASPDYAMETLRASLQSARRTFDLNMYQVTSSVLCDELVDMHQRGVEMNLLVSRSVFSVGDCMSARACYAKLHAAGIRVHKTPKYYQFSHQKVWIVDGQRVGWSTGNWSPTDFPEVEPGARLYPAKPSSTWKKINRDFNVISGSQAVAAVFKDVMEQDKLRGTEWAPDADIACGFGF